MFGEPIWGILGPIGFRTNFRGVWGNFGFFRGQFGGQF